jgi:hypothetical protein
MMGVKATMTRLAAMLLIALVCADLVGADCARLSAESVTSAAPCGANSESPDCLCCSVADETVRVPPGGCSGPAGLAHSVPPAAPVDGMHPVPYRPPLCPIRPPVL